MDMMQEKKNAGQGKNALQQGKKYPPLKDLNLIDDFLMNKISSLPEVNEEFFKEFLSVVLQVKLRNINVVAQKVYYGTMPGYHGTRIDVYVEGDEVGQETGSIYDVEPENGVGKKEELPKRVRFYHAKIDNGCLGAGESYKKLKRVFVIVVSSFDPFDRNRMVYTIKNRCVELPDLPYDDGACTMFLYTRGTEGNPPKELQELLHYMEETTRSNAKNDRLVRIQDMVDLVKSNREVSIEYMKIAEREDMIREEAAKEAAKEAAALATEAERKNTDRERKRAEQAQKSAEQAQTRAEQAERELQKLKDEKIEEEKDKEISEARLNKLLSVLLDENKIDDLKRCMADKEYQEELMRTYHIE